MTAIAPTILATCGGLVAGDWTDSLYGPLLHHAIELAQRRYGFTLMGMEPCFIDQRTGQVLQYDAVFMSDPSRCAKGEEAALL